MNRHERIGGAADRPELRRDDDPKPVARLRDHLHVGVLVPAVAAPFPDVAENVVQPERVRVEPASRSIGQIVGLIREMEGCVEVAHQYKDNRIAGLRFTLTIGAMAQTYQLPCRMERVFQQLQQRRRRRPEDYTEVDQKRAEQIAWRQLYRWLEAQLALEATEMVTAHEIFFPYLLNAGTNQTMFEHYASSYLLPAAKEDNHG